MYNNAYILSSPKFNHPVGGDSARSRLRIQAFLCALRISKDLTQRSQRKSREGRGENLHERKFACIEWEGRFLSDDPCFTWRCLVTASREEPEVWLAKFGLKLNSAEKVMTEADLAL